MGGGRTCGPARAPSGMGWTPTWQRATPAGPSTALQTSTGKGGQAGRGGAGRGGAGLGQDCVASITASGRLLILDTRTACVLCGPGCLPSRSGAFHPEVEDEMLAALRATFSPEGYPTPAMRAAGMLCGCSYGWTDPCRSEFKQASGSCLPGINT